jgi:phage terminase large subunit GpA-like protein
LELEVVGWGPGEESWGIDYRVLYGDPGKLDVWQMLEDALGKTYAGESGVRQRISAACIDSGGHFTQQVYSYCRGKSGRRIFAIKGATGVGRPIVSAAIPRRTGRNRRPVDLFIVGVDEAKGLIYSRLKLQEPGPGYCHFPARPEYDEEHFAQLTAEKIVTRYQRGFPKREWVKTRPRNEALDCRVYALAALCILNPAWEALARRAAAKDESPPTPKPAPIRQSPWIRRRPGTWVDRWRYGL